MGLLPLWVKRQINAPYGLQAPMFGAPDVRVSAPTLSPCLAQRPVSPYINARTATSPSIISSASSHDVPKAWAKKRPLSRKGLNWLVDLM